jgi:hypothetical protein
MPNAIQQRKASLPTATSQAKSTVAAIRTDVLNTLGRPDDLARVDIVHVYDNRYRVNVYRHVEGRTRMTDSFFVHDDPDGISSSPPIRRKYHGDVIDRYIK